MGQILQVNGDYNIKVGSGNTITLDTGFNVGEVVVTGDLIVAGLLEPKNLAIRDNILTLNQKETNAGVSLNYAGIAIDRGLLENVGLIWNEELKTWTFSSISEFDEYSFDLTSRLQLTELETDNVIVNNLTSGRIVFVGNDSSLIDSSELTYNSESNTLTVIGSVNVDDINIDSNIISTNNTHLILNPGNNLIFSGSTIPNVSKFQITDNENTRFEIDSYSGNVLVSTPELSTGSTIFDIVTTWNNPSEIFQGFEINLTNLSSSSESRFLKFVNNNQEKFSIDLDGNIRVDGKLFVVGDLDISVINIEDNVENAFLIQTETDEYVKIDTTDFQESITFKTADVVISEDLIINGGNLTTSAITFNLINENATTVNFASAATNIQIGAVIGTTSVNNNLVVEGDLTVKGTQTSLESIELKVEDPLVKFGNGNTADLFSIGFYGEYVDELSNQAKTGLFRDHITKDFYLFDKVTEDISSTNIINTENLLLANLRAGIVTAETFVGVIDGGTY